MKTTAAIRPVIKNVLNTAENQPMAVKMNHTERIAPRTAPIIRPMAPIVRTRCPVAGGRADGKPGRLRSDRVPSLGAAACMQDLTDLVSAELVVVYCGDRVVAEIGITCLHVLTPQSRHVRCNPPVR